ncbi:MAG: 16S rRNA (cytosine(967)-C(5))-methyltransferase RsmB [Clostridia bacterium]|nr:16S rRNA (cytosine(967)-C(5))-methyltransferase RsmB [Clostridia bacterium]
MTGERVALNILLKVTQEEAYLNLALKDGLKAVDKKDRHRLTALILASVEHMSYCDFLIGRYAKGRLHSSIRCILRMAIAEMFFMDTPDYAVCSKAVKLTAEIGKVQLKGYVNGVLRAVLRDKESDSLPELPDDLIKRMSILSSCPEFLVEEYAERFGEAFTEEMLNASVKGVTVRPVPPFTLSELEELFASRGLSSKRSGILDGALILDSLGGDLGEDPYFIDGRFAVQSEGAMLAVRCLDLEPGMKTLDACAAPGGKTAYILDILGSSDGVSAWELHPHRAELTDKTLLRLGKDLKCAVKDATVYDGSFADSFDRILLDVPCSGLGIGAKPDARIRRTADDIERLAVVQRAILDTCSRYLKTGGILVYSTCTISRTENEDVVNDFIARNKGFELVPVTGSCSENVLDRGKDGMLQLFPNIDGTDGFFIAKLRRKA